MTKRRSRYRHDEGIVCIDLKLREIAQLFDSRDPAPFLERDLDDNAVDYIVSAALEHSRGTPIKLVIHLPESASSNLQRDLIIDSIHNHFAYDAELVGRKLRHTLRTGQVSLIVGLLFLTGCLSLSHWLIAGMQTPSADIIREGLIILGWVAMWRPIDVFLYSWWPKLERKRTFERLSRVPIQFSLKP